MAKTVKTKKNKPSSLSIFAAIVLILSGVGCVLGAVYNLIAPVIIPSLEGESILLSVFLACMGDLAGAVLFAILGIIAAILILAERSGKAALIPLGLMAFYSVFYIINEEFAYFIQELQLTNIPNYVLAAKPFAILFVSLCVGFVFAAFLFVASKTFLKKNVKILYLILSAVYCVTFGLDAVQIVGDAALTIYGMFTELTEQNALEIAKYIVNEIVPVLGDSRIQALFFVGVVLATFGLKKKPSREDQIIETVAVPTVEVPTVEVPVVEIVEAPAETVVETAEAPAEEAFVEAVAETVEAAEEPAVEESLRDRYLKIFNSEVKNERRD